MKRFWQAADGVFRGLLVLEMAIVGLHFLGLGLGWPGRFVLIDLKGGDGIPSWISFLQLVLIGTLFILSARFQEEADDEPSGIFLLFSGLFFLLLSLRQTTLPALKAADLLQGLPVALFLGVLAFRAGRRSFTAMWTRFHRESVIILAGLWLHLFGSVGVEILEAFFLRNSSVLAAGGKAFFEMSGGTVILYGLLLFRRERGRWTSRLAVA